MRQKLNLLSVRVRGKAPRQSLSANRNEAKLFLIEDYPSQVGPEAQRILN